MGATEGSGAIAWVVTFEHALFAQPCAPCNTLCRLRSRIPRTPRRGFRTGAGRPTGNLGPDGHANARGHLGYTGLGFGWNTDGSGGFAASIAGTNLRRRKAQAPRTGPRLRATIGGHARHENGSVPAINPACATPLVRRTVARLITLHQSGQYAPRWLAEGRIRLWQTLGLLTILATELARGTTRLSAGEAGPRSTRRFHCNSQRGRGRRHADRRTSVTREQRECEGSENRTDSPAFGAALEMRFAHHRSR